MTEIIIGVVAAVIIGLVGVVYTTLNRAIMSLQDAVKGINGSAKEIVNLAKQITNIQHEFVMKKDCDSKMRIRELEDRLEKYQTNS